MHKKIKIFDFKDGQILISTVLKFVFFVTPKKKMNNRFYLLQKVYKVHVTANKQCTPISYVQFKILMHFFFKIHITYTCNSDLHKLGRLHLLVYGLDKEEAPLQKIR